MDKETIDLDNAAQITIHELSKTISETSPRFTFYDYDGSLGKTNKSKKNMESNLLIKYHSVHLHMSFQF